MVELAPHYYRDNFERLYRAVEDQYGDLLAAGEQHLLRRFERLSFDAQCLYVRLVSRVGPWFREGRLHYPELGDMAPLLDQLLESGMASEPAGLEVQELGQLYTRDELSRVFSARLPGLSREKKEEQLRAIESLELDGAVLCRELSAGFSERLVAPAGLEVVQLLQVLFFGNRHQGLTEFVLSDLGVASYYPYELDRRQRLFSTRETLEEYLQCCALSDSARERLEQGDRPELLDTAVQVSSLQPRSGPARHRWFRLCNNLGREMERLGEHSLALDLYSASELHPARERRARVLESCGAWAEAEALCTSILESPWCEEERDAARRMQPRLQRKLGKQARPRPRDSFEEVCLQLSPGDEAVELLAARALAPGWTAVHYVENHLFNTLFGLAFWEQIFAPVPGAFHNPYQGVPADMYQRGFREQRRNMLERRLQQLRSCSLVDELGSAYQRYFPYQCRWVSWRSVDRELVEHSAAVIPPDHLVATWERMLFDPGESRRGFPDLIALGEAAGEYRLIEVKGPGDKLQESQKRWLRFFQQQGIPAAVARVEWTDD